MMYKRVLLKLSGEALANGKGIYDPDFLDQLAEELKEISSSGIEMGIVVGAGNLIRGRTLETMGFDRVRADYMGMMGTIMNALALESVLLDHNVKAKALTSVDTVLCEKYDVFRSRQYLNDGYVTIFGGGVSQPYFSTDSASVLRAIENKCEVVLMAKNGTDGVYSADPSLNKDAIKYDELTYDDLLAKNLKVIDQSAAAMANEYGIESLVFNMNERGNIKKAINGEANGTIIRVKKEK